MIDLRDVLIRHLTEGLRDGALWTQDGPTIWTRISDPVEYGLLTQAARGALRMLPLREGDALLLKDPFLGGPGCARWTLLSPMPSGLFLATAFTPEAAGPATLPPAPLRWQGAVNDQVLAALGAAADSAKAELARHDEFRARLAQPTYANLFTPTVLKEDRAHRRAIWKALADEWPEGEILHEQTFAGDRLRLRLTHEHGHLLFDFNGSTGAAGALPLAATEGLLRWLFWQWLGEPALLQGAIEENVSISAPAQTFINAKNGANCDRGLRETSRWVLTAVESLLCRWDRRTRRGPTNYFDLRLDFETDGAVHHLLLPPGSSAQGSEEGDSFWHQRPHTPSLRIEELERKSGLRAVRLDERQGGAARAQPCGGRGLCFVFIATRPGRLRWNGDGSGRQLKVLPYQVPWSGNEVRLQRADSESTLGAGDWHDIHPGDQLSLVSGSGGGLQAAEEP